MGRKALLIYKAFFGVGVAGLIIALILIALGNMLGVWLALFSGFALYRDYRAIKNMEKQHRKEDQETRETK